MAYPEIRIECHTATSHGGDIRVVIYGPHGTIRGGFILNLTQAIEFNENLGEAIKAICHEYNCVECDLSFRSTRRDARYCSVACRMKAYRKRLTAETCNEVRT